MFQILYPLGLLAALGIIIPIIIHLWNIKSGKTLKIGSIFLLGSPSNQRSRSFRVQDWWLLLLRSLLILLAAVLVAEPVYLKSQNAPIETKWLLLEKAKFSKIWKEQHSKVDSLLKIGYEVHDFAVGFNKIDLKDSATIFSTPAGNKLPYAALLRQLNHLQPAGTNIHIFTENKRSNFTGIKPLSRLNLRWEFITPDSTESKWIAAAYQLQDGGIRSMEAVADEKGTYYKASQITQETKGVIPVDTTTTLVQLYAPSRSVDVEYVRAAITAIAQYTERKINIEVLTRPNEVNPHTKVLFWLSDKQPSSAQRATLPKGVRLFTYEGDEVENFRSEVYDLNGVALQHVALLKSTHAAAAAGKTVWADGKGQQVLALNQEAGIDHYLFYSRFRPDWMEMVWSDQMVYFLLPIILPESTASVAFRDAQKGPVSAVELKNKQQVSADANLKQQNVAQDVSPWFWYALLLLFFVERWITYTKRKLAP